jgi:hypothetical protein
MKEYQSGVRSDPRPLHEVEKDYLHPSGSVALNWKPKTSFKRYKQRLQDGSFSCVFQSGAKALEVLTGKVISATPYFWRKNYPDKGAYLQDCGDILYNRFSTTETSSPSQNQSEATMNTIKNLTTNIGITGYRTIVACRDIDQIAEAIEAYGQCLVTFGSNGDEWDEKDYTPVYKGSSIEFYHAICAVDYALINNVKTLICEDSSGWWSSPDGLRLITENFLSNRATGALYFLGAKDISVPQDENLKVKLMEQVVALLKQYLSLLLKK